MHLGKQNVRPGSKAATATFTATFTAASPQRSPQRSLQRSPFERKAFYPFERARQTVEGASGGH